MIPTFSFHWFETKTTHWSEAPTDLRERTTDIRGTLIWERERDFDSSAWVSLRYERVRDERDEDMGK